MKPFVVMIAVVTAMLPVQARAAFQTCADARNYGANTARLFVSQVFNRGNCRANGLGQSHDALVNVWKTQVLRTNDSDQEKVCYYEGLWAGTLEGLSTEYSQCSGYAYECIDRSVLARLAAAEFYAMSQALQNSSIAGDEIVSLVLRVSEPAGPVAACGASQTNFDNCFAQVRDTVGQSFAGANYEPLETLARAVCTDDFD